MRTYKIGKNGKTEVEFKGTRLAIHKIPKEKRILSLYKTKEGTLICTDTTQGIVTDWEFCDNWDGVVDYFGPRA